MPAEILVNGKLCEVVDERMVTRQYEKIVDGKVVYLSYSYLSTIVRDDNGSSEKPSKGRESL